MNAPHTSTAHIFIDASLPDLATLRAGLPADAVVHWLDAARNGLQQIADALNGQTDIAALHLISHGAPGKLFIGNFAVDREILANSLAEMEAISNVMAEDGELLIYGCEVAAGREGRQFIHTLTSITGLKVAAATHKVGATQLGGSWVLDDAPRAMNTPSLRSSSWNWTLPAATPIDLTLNSQAQWYRPDYLFDAIGASLPTPTHGALETGQWGTFTTIPTPQTTDLYNYAYVKFSVSASGNYSFNITNTTLSDAVIFLYGSDFVVGSNQQPSGTFIVGDDDSWDDYFSTNGQNEFWPGLKDVTLAAGTYYLVFSSYTGADTGTVTLEASGASGSVSIVGGTIAGKYIQGDGSGGGSGVGGGGGGAGGGGIDTLVGTAGNDIIFGDGSGGGGTNGTVLGGQGGAGADTISGGAGNDIIFGDGFRGADGFHSTYPLSVGGAGGLGGGGGGGTDGDVNAGATQPGGLGGGGGGASGPVTNPVPVAGFGQSGYIGTDVNISQGGNSAPATNETTSAINVFGAGGAGSSSGGGGGGGFGGAAGGAVGVAGAAGGTDVFSYADTDGSIYAWLANNMGANHGFPYVNLGEGSSYAASGIDTLYGGAGFDILYGMGGNDVFEFRMADIGANSTEYDLVVDYNYFSWNSNPNLRIDSGTDQIKAYKNDGTTLFTAPTTWVAGDYTYDSTTKAWTWTSNVSGGDSRQSYTEGNQTQYVVLRGVSAPPDTTAPVYQSAATSTDGTKVTLTYDESLSSTTASTNQFWVTINGHDYNPANVAVSGSTVELTLSTPIAGGQTVTVIYNDPTGNNDANAVQDALGNDGANLWLESVTNNVLDTTVPAFQSAATSTDGTKVILTYDEALSATTAASGAFAVTVGGNAATISSAAVSGSTVELTLQAAATQGQSVTVAYTAPTPDSANTNNAVQDATGNDAVTLASTSVTNNVPDTIAPVFASAAVNGTSLVLTYTEASTLDATHIPSTTDFAVSGNNTVSAVVVDANAKTVTLTLGTAVLNGDTVTVSYTDPTTGDDPNATQDAAGNDAASITNRAVTNNTPVIGKYIQGDGSGGGGGGAWAASGTFQANFFNIGGKGGDGGGGDDTLTGGAGKDIIFGDGGGGGAGGGTNASGSFSNGGSGVDQAGRGGQGNDVMHGGDADDIIFGDGFSGNAGSDASADWVWRLSAGSGALNGGGGGGAVAGNHPSGQGGPLAASGGTNSIESIQAPSLWLANWGNAPASGSGGANSFMDDSGLLGMGGVSTAYGAGGGGGFGGAAGGIGAGYQANGGDGQNGDTNVHTYSLTSSGLWDYFKSAMITNYQWISADSWFKDTYASISGQGSDELYGDAGNDVLYAMGGNDTLDGGAGNDELNGGKGDDLFVIDLADAGASDTDTLWDLGYNFNGWGSFGGVGADNDKLSLRINGTQIDSTKFNALTKTVVGSDLQIVFNDASLPGHQVTVVLKGQGAATPANLVYVPPSPVFGSAAVNGTSLVMTYDLALDATNIPVGSNFTVKVGGSTVNLASSNAVVVNSANKTVTLALANAVAPGDTVTVSYTDPTTGNDSNAIQSTSGLDATGITNQTVTNNTPDTTAPVYQSASINGTTLTLDYDEGLSSTLPASSEFTLKVNGQAVSSGISGVAINGNDDTKLDLTLANPVYFGQTVTISYTDPTTGNDASALEDSAGNDVASFADYGVANSTMATSTAVVGSQLQGEQVTLAIGGGLSINAPTNSAAPTNLGKSLKMPLGQFAFNITGLQNGGSAQLSMTADADLKQLTYYKWNYLTSKYTNIAKSVSIDQANNKATVYFDLVDGGAYDADRTANGTIVDPGGVAENKLLPVILENVTAVGDVTALNTDSVNGTLSYAITGGADAAKFSISNTGALAFLSAPNFESPTDAGDTAQNNTYAVTVTINGSNGGSEVQPLIVTVMNVPETGDPTVGSNVDAVEATLTVTQPPNSAGAGGSITPPVTNDGDNIPPAVEDAAPSLPSIGGGMPVAGDGNGDGVADSQQASVTSVAFRNTETVTSNPNAPVVYVTLTADTQAGLLDTGDSNTAILTNVAQLDAPTNKPADLDMPLGLISFTAAVGTAGTSETFSLFVDGNVPINGYWKQAPSGDWVNLASAEYGGQVITVNGKTRLDFNITDGGIFDNDGKADGVITDPGAAGYLQPINSKDTDNDQFPDALEVANGLKVGTKDNDVFASSKLFVMQTYRDILFREAEPAGLDHWKAKIDSGMSRAEVAASFLDSSEFQNSAGGISRLYFGGLGRMPDKQGMDNWMAEYQSGTSLNQISSAVVASNEFQSKYGTLDNAAFVNQLYLNVLGRSADSAGSSNWLNAMNTGASRGDILLGFTESAEYKVVIDTKVSVTLDYIGLLDRTPDQAGFDGWVQAQDAGMPEVVVIGGFLGAQEYHDRFLP